jgi:hypothetical protein
VFFLDAGRGVSFVPHDRGRGILKLSESDEVENSSMTLSDVREQIRESLGAAR